MAIVDTGLGWSADSDWLVNTTNTWLGSANQRYPGVAGNFSFYKANTGYAVVCYVHRNGINYGPWLLSTDRNLSAYTILDNGTTMGTYYNSGTYEYAGLTWYFNAEYHTSVSTAEYTYPDWLHFYEVAHNNLGGICNYILTQAGVIKDSEYKISNCRITLEKAFWVYTGERIEPNVIIYDPKHVYYLINETDYSLAYSNNLNPGRATIVITGKDRYTGTSTLQFTILPVDDPYNDGGVTEPGGGSGDFDNNSTAILVPSLPTLSSLNSKFITLWVPTISQLQTFSDWLWTNTGLVDSLIKVYANPIDHILGLHTVPVDVSYADYGVNIGNIPTGVTMRRALTQYIPIDCGTIDVEEYWGGYLDYSPYTKLQLYLPFIGFIQLDADSVMGRTLGVKYNCDILSGTCVAFVTVNNNIAYTFTGNFASQVPITNNDLSRITGGTVTGVGTGIGLGLKAATALGGGSTGIIGGTAAGVAGAIASGVVASKQQVGRSGSISSTAGLLGYKRPYLIIDRPRQATPSHQNTFTGYPGFITVLLADLIGYTQIEKIHLDNVPATDSEIDEILDILHNGFII